MKYELDEQMAIKYAQEIADYIDNVRSRHPDDFAVILFTMIDLASTCLIASCDTEEARIAVTFELLAICNDACSIRKEDGNDGGL